MPRNPKPSREYDKDMAEKLYRAISTAETGPYSNPWIRNMADPASSAYGPAQITYSTMQNYLNNRGHLFNDEEKEYMKKFIEQGKKFIWHNTSKNGITDGKYALGGGGDLAGDEYKQLYESVAKKMLYDHYNEADADINKTWYRWRFGYAKNKKDPRYKKVFLGKMNELKKVSTKDLENREPLDKMAPEATKDNIEDIKTPEMKPQVSDGLLTEVLQVPAASNVPIEKRRVSMDSVVANLNTSLSSVHPQDESLLRNQIQKVINGQVSSSSQYATAAEKIYKNALDFDRVTYEDELGMPEGVTESQQYPVLPSLQGGAQELKPTNTLELGGYIQPNGRRSQFKRDEDLEAQNKTTKI